MDGKLITYAIYGLWALGSAVVWGVAFRDDLRDFYLEREQERMHKRRDRRGKTAFQELLTDLGLLLVAIASAVSIATLIIGQDIPGVRGFALAIALGGFLGAGIVKVTLRRTRRG